MVGTPDDLLARILDGAAACVKKREDQFRQTTLDLPTQLAKCIEFGVGIFLTFFANSNKFFISWQRIFHLIF
jgi:hypothetical protein